MLDFPALALQCGPEVATEVIQRIVTVESSFNPFAIGVVGGRLQRQPKTKEEAVVTAQYLASNGWNFSMGLGQINRYNLSKYGLDYESVFEPCHNLRATASIYQDCFDRAAKTSDFASARMKAYSCYYSGNFNRGFIADVGGGSSYVERIANVNIDKTAEGASPILVIPSGTRKSGISSQSESASSRKSQYSDVDAHRLKRLDGKASTSGGIKQLRGE
ncbi:lytic transglycosylase domain-containing protein [Citrobacter freundii]|nr:lytic transglycosylase domain-containing protein [Citrobacter freundii]